MMIPSTTERTVRRPLPHPGQAGFTLIEMMAVIAIMGMIFAVGVPRMNTSKLRLLKNDTESIAASLQFARQRAVMTAIPHRVLFDLEEGGYRVEWLVTEDQSNSQSLGGSSGAGLGGLLGEPDSVDSISLRPPTAETLDYYPIGHRQLGSFSWIDQAVYFVGLESAAGWVESGDVAIVFQADGTTEYALLELADSDENHITLEIEPVLDRVGLRSGAARS